MSRTKGSKNKPKTEVKQSKKSSKFMGVSAHTLAMISLISLRSNELNGRIDKLTKQVVVLALVTALALLSIVINK